MLVTMRAAAPRRGTGARLRRGSPAGRGTAGAAAGGAVRRRGRGLPGLPPGRRGVGRRPGCRASVAATPRGGLGATGTGAGAGESAKKSRQLVVTEDGSTRYGRTCRRPARRWARTSPGPAGRPSGHRRRALCEVRVSAMRLHPTGGARGAGCPVGRTATGRRPLASPPDARPRAASTWSTAALGRVDDGFAGPVGGAGPRVAGPGRQLQPGHPAAARTAGSSPTTAAATSAPGGPGPRALRRPRRRPAGRGGRGLRPGGRSTAVGHSVGRRRGDRRPPSPSRRRFASIGVYEPPMPWLGFR